MIQLKRMLRSIMRLLCPRGKALVEKDHPQGFSMVSYRIFTSMFSLKMN